MNDKLKKADGENYEKCSRYICLVSLMSLTTTSLSLSFFETEVFLRLVRIFTIVEFGSHDGDGFFSMALTNRPSERPLSH